MAAEHEAFGSQFCAKPFEGGRGLKNLAALLREGELIGA
jgi:hypothetical protein